MTSERRQDVFLVALVLSAVLHVALMLWVRSHVMTQVSSPRRSPKHGQIAMRDAPPITVPKDVKFFPEETAKKAAPTAKGGDTAPVADEAMPIPTEEVRLSVPTVPEVAAKLEIENLVATVKPTAPMMVSDAVKVSAPSEAKPEFMVHSSSDLKVMVPAPSAVAPGLDFSSPEAFHASIFTPKRKSREIDEYVVPKEVLDLVDEHFIEREKDAVRRLIDVDNALDLAQAVNIRLEKTLISGWTYFRMTVTPKTNLPSVPKDVVVLLDASGSIGYDRLASCRKAAKRVLRSCMNTGDRFNLVAFRDKFSYAFRSWQECNAASFAASDKWLANLAAHGRTDVFSTIRSVLTLPRDPKRPLIAMVITDGDANQGVSETKDILSKFSELNGGLISVYMYGVRKSANRELIDVLTHGNRGESVVYDDWKMWNAGEGIEGLSERFRDPLVTDLRVVFAAPLRASAYPKALKNLYRGNSVVITGRLPGAHESLDFSLKGLAAGNAYESFFRLPFSKAVDNGKLPAVFATEYALDARVK